MRPYAVHEDEIRLLRQLRSLPAHEREIALGFIAELATFPRVAAILPPNVHQFGRIITPAK